MSTYQKEMIETDSYLYTANNDRDDAGSDKHNSKHIHQIGRASCRERV